MQINGLVAAVTGGGSGLGEATARALAANGAKVACLDVNMKGAEAVAADIGGAAIRCDVSSAESGVAAMAEIREKLGDWPRILVNCAGIARDLPVMETSTELFRQIMDVNVTGSFITCKAAVERMGDELAIVNISSVSGVRANKGRVAYGASKAAVKLMSEVMAGEWGRSGVRINVIAPGPIDTPLIARLHTPEDRLVWTSKVPQGRYGDTEEIAAAVSFLVSDEASYITGHTLAVDGGFLSAGILADNKG